MTFYRRLLAALKTPLSLLEVVITIKVILLFAAVVFPFGFISGFLIPENAAISPARAALLAVAAIFTPALAEEILFRVMPIPHPMEGAEPRVSLKWSLFSLLVFVASHPLKAALFRQRLDLFTDPRFLLFATLLGGACTYLYLRTGSLWPPVLLHWATVAIWLLFLGGYARIT